jgi:nucleotide-binding universal stress UspA family protein
MIKDILVNLSTNSDRDAARDYAISIAQAFGAHLTGFACAYEPVISSSIFDGYAASIIATYREETRQAALAAKDKFEGAISAAGVLGDTLFKEAGFAEAASIFGDTARHYDLSVVGQARPDSEMPEELIIHGALFGSGRPVLVVPYIQQIGLKLDRVMVCWDGSRNAARAIADAMPVLKRAGTIDVVTVEPRERRNELAGAEIAQHLARHGLKVELRPLVAPDTDVPNTILSYAADSDTDFIVMGGYGHSRLREFILGGATHGMLESMTVPTLMAH